MYLVIRSQTGPAWDAARPMEEQSGWAVHARFMDDLVAEGTVVLGGPLRGGPRVALVIEATSEAALEATLADDPWSGSHLLTEAIDPWTIRLDGRPC